jgi:hypothetical protein
MTIQNLIDHALNLFVLPHDPIRKVCNFLDRIMLQRSETLRIPQALRARRRPPRRGEAHEKSLMRQGFISQP